MLITCNECGHEISDKAYACPYCGNPMTKRVRPRKSGRPRLPNGFGQISLIKGKRLRNPYRAMVTIGKTDEGRPICRLLQPVAYFPTYNEAYAALLKYNQNPYDLDKFITMQDLYERWSKEHFAKIKEPGGVEMAWAYCSMLYDIKVIDVRARHLKACLDSGYKIVDDVKVYPSSNIKVRMKSTFNLMLDYALEYELVDRNYARTFNLSAETLDESKQTRISHMPFDDYEMQQLWKHINDVPYIDVLLFQCYTGFRPQELELLLVENLDMEKWTVIGGIKTKAGTNRTVPIHPRIRKIVARFTQIAQRIHSPYLINCYDLHRYKNDPKMTYYRYKDRFENIIDELMLKPGHRPHDGRKHFISMAKKYGVDEYAIKYIVGHAVSDITEAVYTQRDPGWLMEEIEKIR